MGDPMTPATAETSGTMQRRSRQAQPVARVTAGVAAPHTEAFAINFVRPHPLKVCVQHAFPIVTLVYLAVNVAVCLVLVVTLCYFLVRPRDASTAASPAAVIQEMSTLQDQARQNLTELQTIIAAQRQQFPVAGKLAALANTLPPRTWISHIEGTRENRVMTIRALYVIDPEKPYELPARGWIESLKADPVFGHQLKQLSLRQSSRETLGNTELCSFELAAEWNP